MLQHVFEAPEMSERPVLARLARVARPWRRADRFQVGALPWRRSEEGAIQVMLITSRGTGQWIVPKGGVEPGLGLAASAAEEAWEEAGVRGRIEEEEAGRFTHMKTREGAPALRCRVAVYRLEVLQVAQSWPERGQRKRRWFGLEEAMTAVRAPELRALFADLRRQET